MQFYVGCENIQNPMLNITISLISFLSMDSKYFSVKWFRNDFISIKGFFLTSFHVQKYVKEFVFWAVVNY